MLEKRLQNYDMGRSSGTHGRIWCECSLANLCRVRQRLCEAMLHDPELLLSQRYPHNVSYLQEVRHSSVQIGLATMSCCHYLQRILKVLGLSNALTLVPREMMSNMASLILRSISIWHENWRCTGRLLGDRRLACGCEGSIGGRDERGSRQHFSYTPVPARKWTAST